MDATRSCGDAQDQLERSSHTAFIEDNILYVLGGYRARNKQDVLVPCSELWLCHLDTGIWELRGITGEVPPELSGFCSSYLNGTLYMFAGCDSLGYTNQFHSVDLREECYTWKSVTDTKGMTPSPRNRHSCWIHGDRLIYFGGYGCKTLQEIRNANSSSFVVEETAWAAIGTTFYRCWGWNNEVHEFDTRTATWTQPETRGPAPAPRGSHACAILGGKGYVCGGLETKELDMYCLDMDTWTWTQIEFPSKCAPIGRSMHTLTPTSDHNLFMFGGLAIDGTSLSDAWEFNALKGEWRQREHPHKDKPRLWHTAYQGKDDDVVVFGGSHSFDVLGDSVVVLRAPCQQHCKDLLFFQTQPYSLSRLCEDNIAKSTTLLGEQLMWLPPRLQDRVDKRITFFSNSEPTLIT